MLRVLALAVLLGIGAGSACTIFPVSVRFDTISPGVVAVLKADSPDTIRISRHADMKAHFEGYFSDSALVFLAKIDTMIMVPATSDTLGLTADVLLSSFWDTVPASNYFHLYMRFRVDSLFKGSLPGKVFWARTGYAYPMCGPSLTALMGKAFLNSSSGFTRQDHVRMDQGMNSQVYWPGFPLAHFFDGRYLVAPAYPGLKLDITELFPTYPATGILQRNSSILPVMKPAGKAYLPDGRVVPETPKSGRKAPRPVLR